VLFVGQQHLRYRLFSWRMDALLPHADTEPTHAKKDRTREIRVALLARCSCENCRNENKHKRGTKRTWHVHVSSTNIHRQHCAPSIHGCVFCSAFPSLISSLCMRYSANELFFSGVLLFASLLLFFQIVVVNTNITLSTEGSRRAFCFFFRRLPICDSAEHAEPGRGGAGSGAAARDAA
jgi:hypothetical protein